ncbi:phosphatase 2C-like domain-containing protein [Mycena polygramma]|nr:phosphatase 2C-like domain-containing protein [Mycena polygramma]
MAESAPLISRLLEASPPCILFGTHALSVQPLSTVPSEDRYFVEEWSLRSGIWKTLAVFDGHGAGTEAVEFVLSTLPTEINSACAELTKRDISNEIVEELLIQCIRDVDMRIQAEFTALLPGPADIGDMSPEAIQPTLRDPDSSEGHSRVEVLRARTGTTATVALIDPNNAIHVASLGDCDAILATQDTTSWQTTILSARHNCSNENEVARIKAEHPGETECVDTETRRVLGLIAVTRALGDTLFKLPAVYTERVAPVSLPPIHPNYDLKGLAARNLSPPYLSNIAQVTHVPPPQSDVRRLLIMASDGLNGMLSRSKNVCELSEAAELWSAAAVSDASGTGNMAVDVLWDALHTENGENLYESMIAGQYRGRVDDITVIVYPL